MNEADDPIDLPQSSSQKDDKVDQNEKNSRRRPREDSKDRKVSSASSSESSFQEANCVAEGVDDDGVKR